MGDESQKNQRPAIRQLVPGSYRMAWFRLQVLFTAEVLLLFKKMSDKYFSKVFEIVFVGISIFKLLWNEDCHQLENIESVFNDSF